ncbi:MAG: Ig-like domain-containing protein [Candidatus Micrarchaeales archaeon]
MGNLKLQSAVEYLLTYGWAFLIAAVVVAALYLFVFAPANVIQSSCSFQSGPHCQDLILGSNSLLSKMAMLLTNTNQYTIISPKITVNITGIAPIQGTCRPYLVLPGGSLICNATITPAISQSALASGTFIVSYIPCPGGNVMICSTNQRQNFPGGFTTHASPLLSPTTLNVIITAQNSTQIAFASSQDKLTANVKLLGTPLSGATVNFTSNSVNAVISPIQQTTDGSGNAVTYIYSTQPGNVLVTASYANASSNTVIDFVQGVCFSFSFGSASSASGVITIDGTQYGGSQQACYVIGSSHSYSFASAVSGGAGIQYIYSSSSGCGTSSQSGTVILNANCTLSATYNTVYQLIISASPSAGGSLSETPTCTGTPCNTLWYLTGTSTTLGESANGGYTFSTWAGSGTGSYSGSNTAPSISFNNPITETADFASTTTTSTTSSTTSTTTSTTTTTVLCTGTFGNSATGGTVTYVGGNEIHTFTSSGTFTYSGTSCNAAVLVVAGGGGGGGTSAAGGGGAGGYLYYPLFTINSQSYTVTVGAGGSGGGSAGGNGAQGSSSIFSSITAVGGGGGSGATGCSTGGSGGGAANGGGAGCAGTSGQGNTGGTSSDIRSGGGGGGAGAIGGTGYYNGVGNGGPGGNGLSSIISGSATYYAGGGGGGNSNSGAGSAGAGGLGGGGAGGYFAGGSNGGPNTGGGGGGGGANYGGGNGGSGTVIISLNGLQAPFIYPALSSQYEACGTCGVTIFALTSTQTSSTTGSTWSNYLPTPSNFVHGDPLSCYAYIAPSSGGGAQGCWTITSSGTYYQDSVGSSSSGSGWTLMDSAPPNFVTGDPLGCWITTFSQACYAVTTSGYYTSTSNGAWSYTSAPPSGFQDGDTMGCYDWATGSGGGQDCVMVTSSGYYHTGGGSSWSYVAAQPPNFGMGDPTACYGSVASNGGVGTGCWVLTSGGLYTYSSSWSQYAQAAPSFAIGDPLACYAWIYGNACWTLTSGGLYDTSGSTWTQLTSSPP